MAVWRNLRKQAGAIKEAVTPPATTERESPSKKKSFWHDLADWGTDSYMPQLVNVIVGISPGWGRSLLKVFSHPLSAVGLARVTNLPEPLDSIRSRFQTQLRIALQKQKTGVAPTAEAPTEVRLDFEAIRLFSLDEWVKICAHWKRYEADDDHPERLQTFRMVILGELKARQESAKRNGQKRRAKSRREGGRS